MEEYGWGKMNTKKPPIPKLLKLFKSPNKYDRKRDPPTNTMCPFQATKKALKT